MEEDHSRAFKRFLWSCYLYEVEADAVLSDASYDALCQYLLIVYDELDRAFQRRVPRDQLKTGTASGLTYTAEEIEEARAWRRAVPQPSTSSPTTP